MPIACIPVCAPIIVCSAMYIWTKRSGATAATSSVCVEFPTSPSRTTRSAFSPASQASASPNALRVAIASTYVGAGAPAGAPAPTGIHGSGFGGVIVIDRMPPSSSIARSAISGGSALPCQPSLSAISDTP